MLGCLRLRNSEERKACLIIISIEGLIKHLEEVIGVTERKTGTSRRKKEDIEAIKKELKAIKKKYNITEFTVQIEKLGHEIKEIAAKIFGSASKEFYTLNRLIKDITQDLEVKTKLNEIIKLRRELEERLAGTMKKIKDIGREITTKAGPMINKLVELEKAKLLPLQRKLSEKRLDHDFIKELEEATSKLMAAKIELDKELDSALTSTERDRVEKIRKHIKQLRIMLDLIENPEKIIGITPKELLGF